MFVLWVNTYIPNMGCGKDAIWGGPNLWVALSSFCTLRIWLQLQWRSLSSGSLPQGTILTAHLRHIPWISAKTMRWEQKDSEGWGLPKVTWNSGRDETQRSRRRSYWGLPYLYLDLVLRVRTPAAECLDPKSIWLQVWFLLGAFGRIKVHTVGKSGLILCFHRFHHFPILLMAQLRFKRANCHRARAV